MAFSLGALSAWTNELGDKSDFIMKSILSAKTIQALPGIDKRYGISGYTEKIPTLETNSLWQAGAACGHNTSGTTTIDQISLTTVPIKVQESICLQDLETYAIHKLLPGSDRPETFQLLDMWVGRKLAQTAIKLENAIWGAKTTYTNATHLKHFNGLIAVSDTAATAVAATQQASISASTVRGIIEEIAYTKIPSAIRDLGPVVVCGYDTFNIYLNKLMVDNLFHYNPSNTDLANYKMNVYGTNVKLIGLPGLNNDNAVDTGALPTAVKNRIFATYEDNILMGFNAPQGMEDFKVWYSDDDQLLKFSTRFFFGCQIKYNDLVVQYTNS